MYSYDPVPKDGVPKDGIPKDGPLGFSGDPQNHGVDFEDLLHGLKQVRRRHTASQAEGHARNLLTVSEMNRRITLALAKSVIQELRMKPFASQLRDSSSMASGLLSPEQFLVTERDIQNIIERSLLVMDDGDFEEEEEEGDGDGDGLGQARAESAAPRRKTFSSVNLDSLNQEIRPRPSVVLDPATTISVPKTLFSSSSKHSGRRRRPTMDQGRDRPITATIISRRSVAAITWTKHGGHLGDWSDSDSDSNLHSDSTERDSGRTSPTRLFSVASLPPPVSTDYLRQRRPTRNMLADAANRSPERPARVLFRGGGSSSTASRPRQTSFEWAEPIVWMGDRDRDRDTDRDRERTASTDMYDDGVDAHVGPSSSRRHTLFPEEELNRRWTADRSIFDTSRSTTEPWLMRRSTMALSSLAQRDTDAHADTDTLARGHGHAQEVRHRSVPALHVPRGSRKGASRPNLMSRMAGMGHRLTSGNLNLLGYGGGHSLDPDEDGNAWALPPNNSPSGGQRHKTAQYPWKELDGVGSGGVAVDRNRKCKRCSEDGRPHVCVDDMDPSRDSASDSSV